MKRTGAFLGWVSIIDLKTPILKLLPSLSQLDEGVYHSHLLELNNLLKELTAADAENTGHLTEEQFT